MPRLVALLLAVVILLLGAMTCLPLLREKAVQSRVRLQMEDELRAELARTRELEARIERIKKDTSVVERLAREKFGLGRSGEVIFKFRDPTPAPNPSAPQTSPSTPRPRG
ncbi:MAG: septum formation initiator family protein [Limisphaerales bacterium]